MTRLLKRKFHINTLVFVKDQQGWLRNIQCWNRFRDAVWGPVGNVHSHNLVIALPVLASLPERPEGRFVIQLSRIPRSMPAPRFWSTRPNWWGHETKEIPFASCQKKKKPGRGYHLSLRLIPDFRREISNLFSGGNVFNGARLNLVSLCPCVSVVCICMCVGALVCAGARLEECTQESVILHLNPDLPLQLVWYSGGSGTLELQVGYCSCLMFVWVLRFQTLVLPPEWQVLCPMRWATSPASACINHRVHRPW